jgi:hypothetical protein
MDSNQFDAFVRTFQHDPSRRGLLAGLAGGLLTLLPASLGGQDALAGKTRGRHAGAAKKRHRKPCPPCKKRQKGKCKGTLPDGSACAGGSCQGGSCVLDAASPPPPASPPASPPPPPPPAPQPCTSASTCPVPPGVQHCVRTTCVGGVCGVGPKAAGTVCRPARSECDIAEVCDGASLLCPLDQIKAQGTPCASDGNVCTADICNGIGLCGHFPLPQNTSCGPDQVCCAGTCCIAGQGCGSGAIGRCCNGFGANCDSPSDCCSNTCGDFGTCL